MTIDVHAFSGKPLAAVIDELCMAATPRWRKFEGDVKFSKNREIQCHDPNSLRFGVIDIFAEPTESEIQKRADGVAFAERLRPLIDCLGNGDLSAEGIRVGADAGAPQIIHAAYFRRNWLIHLYDGDATLVLLNAEGEPVSEWQLESVRVPSTISQTISDFSRGAEIKLKKRPQKTGAGGRPPKANWKAFVTELGSKLLVEGLPEKGDGGQERLIEWGLDWFESRYSADKVPGRDGMKKTIAGVLKAARAAFEEGEKPKFVPFVPDKK